MATQDSQQSLKELHAAAKGLLGDVYALSSSLRRFVDSFEDRGTALSVASRQDEATSQAMSTHQTSSETTLTEPEQELHAQRGDIIMTIAFGPHFLACITRRQLKAVIAIINKDNLTLTGDNLCRLTRALRAFQSRPAKSRAKVKVAVVPKKANTGQVITIDKAHADGFPAFQVPVTSPKVEVLFPDLVSILWPSGVDPSRYYRNVQNKWNEPLHEWGPNSKICWSLLTEYLADMPSLKRCLSETAPLSRDRFSFVYSHPAWIRLVRQMKWPEGLIKPRLDAIGDSDSSDEDDEVEGSQADGTSQFDNDVPTAVLAPIPVGTAAASSNETHQPLQHYFEKGGSPAAKRPKK